MDCRYCSAELPEGALFCGECGRAVAAKRPVAGPAERAGSAARQAGPEMQPADPVAAAVDDRCAQCGAELAPADIFCGECGFVRPSIAAPRQPSDTVELDPFPWGRPREQSRAPGSDESDPPPLVLPKAAAPVVADDTDETRIVDRDTKGERFVLQFSTGESVSVRGTGLVGRNPVAEPGEYFDNFVTIVDPGKSVSKTHLEFGQDGGAFWISDRYSGNGTVVREPDRSARRADPGKRYRVVRGTRVDIGEQFFVVS